MSHIPLPSSSTLKSLPSALQWLASKLDVPDPPPDPHQTPPQHSDPIEAEHEASEAARAVEEKKKELEFPSLRDLRHSQVFVPEIPEEKGLRGMGPPPPVLPPARFPETKEKKKGKDKFGPSKHLPVPKPRTRTPTPNEDDSEEVFLTPPSHPPSPTLPASKPQTRARTKPALSSSSTPNHSSSSSSSNSFEITGSSLILPTKTRLDPTDQERVARELKEAMACEFFKMWPVFEDPRSGKKERSPSCGERLEVSGVFKRELSTEEEERRKQIEKEWMSRGERDTQGRRRVTGNGGYESVVEARALMGMSEWGFKPTLGGVELAGGKEGDMRPEIEDTMADSSRAGDRSQGVRSTMEGSTRVEKSRLMDTSMLDPARAKQESRGRSHREHTSSRKPADASTAKQLRSSLRKQPKDEPGSHVPKPQARFSPWAKKRDEACSSSDELPFNPIPRKDKRARFAKDLH